MKNKNMKLVIAMILFMTWGQCFSETKIGLGTGGTSAFSGYFGGVISIPIRLDSNILVEPYIGYLERTQDADNNLPNYRETDDQSYQFGIGLYSIKKLATEYELYYGASFTTGKSKHTFESKTTIATSSSSYQLTTETTDYIVKPTLGISYLIDENLSFSVDAGIYYRWGKEKNENVITQITPTPSVDVTEYTSDIRQIGTFTRIIFRMMF